MVSMFTGTGAAFAPLFDTHVAVAGARGEAGRVSGTFRACIIEGGFDDPIGENGIDTARRTLTVLIPRQGEGAWCFPTPPRIGDTVTTVDGGKYKVKGVNELDEDQYILDVRQ